MTELIRRDDAVKAINDLCIGDLPEYVWTSDAVDAIKKVPTVMAVVDADHATAIITRKKAMEGIVGREIVGN